ncbi:hypothetical protein BCR35DRAFT_89887 [Leucosporidium creatinivorum]|uniref:F-box domain-containing protein n=1 Tax=Leucosporidium creatinivorum TaxID=106004 RepID=A0A1Y2F9Y7_9BASI|nr:hypothetical protein BCR35DRAFT_89887 [Leucosporidium creatinivorum]
MDDEPDLSLPSCSPLTSFPNLQSLTINPVSPTSLSLLLPQLSLLLSLQTLRLMGQMGAPFNWLNLALYLPSSLLHLELHYACTPADILDLVMEKRFDRCRILWICGGRWERDSREVRRVEEGVEERKGRQRSAWVRMSGMRSRRGMRRDGLGLLAGGGEMSLKLLEEGGRLSC